MHLVRLVVALMLVALCATASSTYQYSYVPKKIYDNQLFAVTILETDSKPLSKPHFAFAEDGDIGPILDTPLIVKNGDDSFYTFYFKAGSVDFTLPRLEIKGDDFEQSFDALTIPVGKLKPRKDFCGVLAADMSIKTSQASAYDDQNNIITLSIEGYEANVENMKLEGYDDSGIENISRNYAKVRAEFYLIAPIDQKELKFTYFNTIKKQYVFLETSIVIKDTSLATQSQLNPKDDSFEKLKKDTFVVLSFLFFVLFLIKRDFFFLILSVVSVTTLLTFYTPKEKICILEGSPIYILPTHTSRISQKSDERYETFILGSRDNYTKIEYKNGVIGWVKHEDICKD